jgi:hypothetical protein
LKLARDGEEDGVLGIYAEVTAEVEGAIDGDVVVGAVWNQGGCAVKNSDGRSGQQSRAHPYIC